MTPTWEHPTVAPIPFYFRKDCKLQLKVNIIIWKNKIQIYVNMAVIGVINLFLRVNDHADKGGLDDTLHFIR